MGIRNGAIFISPLIPEIGSGFIYVEHLRYLRYKSVLPAGKLHLVE